jgi:membrane associated rhomboid family serine protease
MRDPVKPSSLSAITDHSWLTTAALLALGAVLAWHLPGLMLDWQPGLVCLQPWRAFTAVFVHYSLPHLAGNLLATALVAAYGWAAHAPRHITTSWWLSWPLMHLALLGQPALQHYGGLSGLMHAGVACVNVGLIFSGKRGQTIVGAIMHVMLSLKIMSETPWLSAVQMSPDWDIPIAPIAHLTGFALGMACAVLMECWVRWGRSD